MEENHQNIIVCIKLKMAKLYPVLLGISALMIPEAFAEAFDCSLLASPEASVDGGVSLVNDYVGQNSEAGTVEFANE